MVRKILGWSSLGCMGCLGTTGLFVGLLLLALLLVKVVWAWTVPDLFPGAVEQGGLDVLGESAAAQAQERRVLIPVPARAHRDHDELRFGCSPSELGKELLGLG